MHEENIFCSFIYFDCIITIALTGKQIDKLTLLLYVFNFNIFVSNARLVGEFSLLSLLECRSLGWLGQLQVVFDSHESS